MSRIRTIKPEFWTSEQVLECSRDARLLFIGLWNFCDDFGRHQFSPKRIKAEIFPGDDLTSENVRGMLDELSTNGLITVYIIDNVQILQVTGWRHQRIDHPQKARFPGNGDHGEDHSANVHGMLAPEGKGKEEGNIGEGSRGEGKDSSLRSESTTLRVVSRAGARTTTHKNLKTQIQEKAEPTVGQLQAATERGLTETERIAEWTKFRTYNRANGSTFASWEAAWSMWLAKLPKPNGHDPPLDPDAAHVAYWREQGLSEERIAELKAKR